MRSREQVGAFRPAPVLLLVAGVVGVFVLHVPSRLLDVGPALLHHAVAEKTTASFGKPVRLDGRAERPPLEVTAQEPKVVRVLTRGVRAGKLQRFVAVELRIRNVGKEAWAPQFAPEVVVGGAGGETYRVDDRVLKVRGARVLRGAVAVQPGRTRQGVAVFSVPRSADLTLARLTVGSGITKTAEWELSAAAGD